MMITLRSFFMIIVTLFSNLCHADTFNREQKEGLSLILHTFSIHPGNTSKPINGRDKYNQDNFGVAAKYKDNEVGTYVNSLNERSWYYGYSPSWKVNNSDLIVGYMIGVVSGYVTTSPVVPALAFTTEYKLTERISTRLLIIPPIKGKDIVVDMVVGLSFKINVSR